MACAKGGGAARAAEPAEEGYLAEQDSEEGAPPPAPRAPGTPAAEEEAPASTKDESDDLGRAIAEFDRARIELSQLIGRDLDTERERDAAPPSAGAAQRSAPAPVSAPADKAASSRAEAAKPMKKGDSGCVNVCRAFDSLTRSAAAVCRLDEGDRCRKANGVVAVARDDAGVKACACKK
jgi:hypothetical protein